MSMKIEKGNNEMNFNLKIVKLQTKAKRSHTIWEGDDNKSFGIWSLIYSASNIKVLKDIIGNVKGRLFRFIWKNKRDKIRREGLYHDYEIMSMDTKAHTGGPSQLEICSRLHF